MKQVTVHLVTRGKLRDSFKGNGERGGDWEIFEFELSSF